MKTIAYKLTLMLMLTAGMLGCKKENLSVLTKGNLLMTNANPTGGIDYYVANNGSDGNDGLSPTVTAGSTTGPFRTINHAAGITHAGDVVNIAAGNYTWENGNGDAVVNISNANSGTANSPITYKGSLGTVIQTYITDNTPAGGINNAIDVNANYITIQEIEIIGHRQAVKDAGGLSDTGNLAFRYNTNGIGIGGFRAGIYPTGVIIKNCKVHDFPGGGIAAKSAGNLTIDGNTTYNNCYYSPYGTSGISILTPKLVGNAGTGYGYFIGGTNTANNIIRNNVSYNNIAYVKNRAQNKYSDGNGIIVDVNFSGGSNTNPNGNFAGITEVENNICYTNGGAGINVTQAQNVNVVNNTTCNNGQSSLNGGGRYAEVQLYNPRNVFFTNNIFYSDISGGNPTSGKAYNNFTSSTAGGSRVIFDYNVYYPTTFPLAPVYNGTTNTYIYNESAYATATNTHNLAANPSFTGTVPTTIGGSTLPTNFNLNGGAASNSGLIGSIGFNQTSNPPTRPYYSYFSYNGLQRTTTIDRGAYEH